MNFKNFIALALLVTLQTNIVLAQNESVEVIEAETVEDEEVTEQEQGENIDEADLEVEEELSEEEEINLLNEKFLEAKNQVNDAQDSLRNSINQTSYLESKLESISEEIYDLEEALEEFEKNIANLSRDILDTNEKIDEITETIIETKDKIEELDVEISYNIEQLLFVVQTLYFETDEAGFFDSDDLQTVKLLLAEQDVDRILEEAENISMLENYMQLTLERLEADKSELNDLYDKFTALKEVKLELRKKLEKEKTELQIQKIAKENLLEATKGEQQIYENLIEKSKTEEAILRQEIISQIAKYKEYRELIESIAGEEVVEDDATFLSWPMEPTKGLSAYFKDPSYKAALGLEHYAIDIPAYSGSSVGAAAPGVVFKVKGGEGNDYHYIIIGHSDGIMTVYGHMYDIFVEEGQTVERGEIIGLSGGTPGTRGAGYLTTGAHLHFEVIEDGVHVDPLPFLDQTKLPGRHQN
jgi:murein DD-endopeptidase MepM/ murein hydrolase activator NlpD